MDKRESMLLPSILINFEVALQTWQNIEEDLLLIMFSLLSSLPDSSTPCMSSKAPRGLFFPRWTTETDPVLHITLIYKKIWSIIASLIGKKQKGCLEDVNSSLSTSITCKVHARNNTQPWKTRTQRRRWGDAGLTRVRLIVFAVEIIIHKILSCFCFMLIFLYIFVTSIIFIFLKISIYFSKTLLKTTVNDIAILISIYSWLGSSWLHKIFIPLAMASSSSSQQIKRVKRVHACRQR